MQSTLFRLAKTAVMNSIDVMTARRLPAACFPVMLGVLALTVIADPPAVSAQGFFRNRPEVPEAEFMPPPRMLRQQIRLSEEAIQNGRISDAVINLGDLLRRNGRDGEQGFDVNELVQDYFLLDPNDPLLEGLSAGRGDGAAAGAVTPLSTMRLIRELIGRMPAVALDTYDLRYGPLARKTLTDAAAQRDWTAVERVRREFFHTLAGYEASMLLAQREWMLGNPLAASMLLDDVATLDRAIDHCGDELIVLHAMARHAAGREITPPARMPESAQAGNDGQKVDWKDWIDARVGDVSLRREVPQDRYAVAGGTLSRNGNDGGQQPLSNPRWMLETSGSPRQGRLLDEKMIELKGTGHLPPPSWTPLLVGDQLLMRTTQRLLGVDHKTGKRVWQYPWFSPADEPTRVEDLDDEEEDPAELLAQRVWNDLPFGQLSSDGQRVFMVDDLSRVEMELYGPFGIRGMLNETAGRNTLVALDLATEGKLLWQVGLSETVPSTLQDAFFLGPPLPVRGFLYVLAELSGEVILVCLNPSDGKEVWRQALISVEAGSITSDPIRRVAGATPTYHEGLLICPTGAGATVAVDLIDRTLRWANEHSRNQQFVMNVMQGTEVSLTELTQRWSDASPIAAGNTVILTPIESDRCVVVDLLTGRNRFAPDVRLHEFYVAGIRDDQFLVVGPDGVVARSIADGRDVWSTPTDMLPTGGQVAGRGVFSPDAYFLPTTTNELLEIDLADGSIRSRRNVRFPLGNLIAVDGEIISQGATMLSVAYGESSLRPRVDAILAEDPDDFTALIRKAELLIEEDRRVEALALLDRLRALEPDNDDVLILSVTAMLGALRQDPTSTSIDLATLQRLIDRPEQQAELLVLRIEGMLSRLAGDDPALGDEDPMPVVDDVSIRRDALGLLAELSDLVIKERTLKNSQASIFPRLKRQLSINGWIAGRAADLVRGADDATAAVLESDAAAWLKSRQDLDLAGITEVVEHFDVFKAVDPIRVQLADRRLQLDDPLAAERWLLGASVLDQSDVDALPTQRRERLAALYAAMGWRSDAQRVAKSLGIEPESADADDGDADAGKMPDAEFDSRINGNFFEPMSSIPLARQRDPETWPQHVAFQLQSVNQQATRRMNIERRYDTVTRLLGEQLVGWQVMRESLPLTLVDPNGISRPIGVDGMSMRDGTNRDVVISGGAMLVMTTSELIAIDLFQVFGQPNRDTVRWRRTLGSDGEAVAKRESIPTPIGGQIHRYRMNSATASNVGGELRLGPVLGDRVILMQGTDLICLNLLTGDEIWRTNQFAPGGVVVADGDRIAVVSGHNNMLTILDARDGRQLESRPRRTDFILGVCGSNALTISRLSNVTPAQLQSRQSWPDFTDNLAAAENLYEPHLIELFNPLAPPGESIRQYRFCSPSNPTESTRTASYGGVLDGRFFTHMTNTGQAGIWDLQTGQSIADVKLEIKEGLYDLAAMQVQDKFLLLPRSRPAARPLGQSPAKSVNGSAAVSPMTEMHAISATTGQALWSRAFDDAWACTTTQPWLTPVVVLVRSQTYRTQDMASPRRELDVACVDIASGEIRYTQEKIQTGRTSNSLETWVKLISHNNEVRADMQGETLIFTFTDTPVDPAAGGENDEDASEDSDPMDAPILDGIERLLIPRMIPERP